MRGTARKRGTDRWQIQVYAGIDPRTGKEHRITRTIAAPHTKAGRKVVDQALAALIVDAEGGRIHVGDDPTLDELLARWVMARSPDWSPKTTAENKRQIRLKIHPRLGSRRLSKIRAVDLDSLYAQLRTTGGEKGQALEPASVRRIHIILHAALSRPRSGDSSLSIRPTPPLPRRCLPVASHRPIRPRWSTP